MKPFPRLRACDIDVGRPTYALVRNTDQRRVKTRNAIRRVNLSAFLPRKVIDELLRYRCERLGCNKPGCNRQVCQLPRSAKRQVPLFENNDATFLDDGDLFAKIHAVMRTTLHDSKVRYHSLGILPKPSRSFSCRSGEADQGTPPKSKMDPRDPPASNALRNRIYASDQVHWSDLHVLANWIGHGSAKTTLTHYCHTFFAIAASFTVSGSLTPDEKKALVLASGTSPATVYRRGQNVVPFRIFKRKFKTDIEKMSHTRAAAATATKAQNQFAKMREFERSLLFVELFLDDSLPMREVFDRTGIPKARGEEITKTLADLVSAAERTDADRHPQAQVLLGTLVAEEVRMRSNSSQPKGSSPADLWPTPPRLHSDEAYMLTSQMPFFSGCPLF